MKDIMGLAVLTSPLFLVIPWLFVAILVAVKASQLPKIRIAKLAAGAATLILVFLLPFADDIAGRIYFNHMCSTEAGVTVYQTVELPAENWDAQGKPKFYDEKNGNSYPISGFDGGWDNYFKKNYYPDSQTYRVSKIFSIEKHTYKLEDNMKIKKYAEQVSFMYWGGWIVRNFSPHNTAASCGNSLEDSTNFQRQLFKPATSIR